MPRLAPFYPAMVVFVGAVLVALGGFWASWRQSNFNQEIRKKNEEISALQKDSMEAVIGGDSYAYIIFQAFDREGKIPNGNAMPDQLLLVPMFIHRGKHPLYDVSARIVDLDLMKKNINSAMNNYSVGNMTPNLAATTAHQILHEGKDFSFNIFFTARNGTWTQFLRMPWIGNGWGSAIKVIRDGRVVFREVSDNFPRTSDGKVDWGEPGAQDVD
ncbi:MULTISPECIES: LapA family protein [unclassified Afipia]|uniref:LapA family protein n=1 Tax=unclassified Afipia TaxID=2642050 RepID=UPI00054F1204|nr:MULTISPECIES: LapA family protein [unclassified Afipia]MBQ8101290.1 LapA family protein [Afipia sp.]